MKKFLAIFVAVFLTFGAGYLLDSSDIPEVDGDGVTSKKLVPDAIIPLPEFKYELLNGEKVSISTLKGRVIILNFWASWCGPCIEEFPEMIKIIKEHKDVTLLAISNDSSKKDILKFIKKMKKDGIDLKAKNIIIAWDKGKDISTEYFNVLRLPETFIINKDHQITKKVVGSQPWLGTDMQEYIKTLL